MCFYVNLKFNLYNYGINCLINLIDIVNKFRINYNAIFYSVDRNFCALFRLAIEKLIQSFTRELQLL